MAKTKIIKRVTLNRLRKASPREFAELCEQAGCFEEAFRYYSKINSPRTLFHAADLAFELGKYKTVRELITRARKTAVEILQRQKGASYCCRGSWGAACSMASAMGEEEESRKKFSEMEKKLAEIGK